MEVPYCKSCDKRHYGPCNTFSVRNGLANKPVVVANVQKFVANDPVIIDFEPKDMANTESGMANVNEQNQAVTGDMANKSADSVTYRYRDPDKRRAYMREYMRKRRSERSFLNLSSKQAKGSYDR